MYSELLLSCPKTIKPMEIFVSAVPFEEDENTPTIWYLDHSYLENMSRMFKKVNGKSQLGFSHNNPTCLTRIF